MIKLAKNQMKYIEALFQGIDDSMVIACLQGYMGEAYADRLPNPGFAFIVSGEYSFFGGAAEGTEAKKIVKNIFEYIEGDSAVAIYASDNLAWRELLLSVPQNNPREVARYGIIQKDYEFDREKLKHFMDAIPEGFICKAFDEKIYEEAMSQNWSREFCETFASAQDYLKRGFGIALHSGATSRVHGKECSPMLGCSHSDFKTHGFKVRVRIQRRVFNRSNPSPLILSFQTPNRNA